MTGERRGRAIAAIAMLGGLAGCAAFEPPLYGEMSETDVAVAARTVQRTLETQPDGAAAHWREPTSGDAGSVQPLRTFLTADGRVCRDYLETLMVGGQRASYRNTACRSDSGEWLWL